MTNYDTFAPFYDAVMGNRGGTIRLIRRQIRRHHPSAHTLLELGCGTGAILQGLARHLQVSGIERSAQMLQIARTKLPTADLRQGTIAGFQLQHRYDVIICIFDTINHLISFSDWQKLFAATLAHLAPEGIFIFDMNTTGRLAYLAQGQAFTQSFGRSRTAHFRVSPVALNLVEWAVTLELPQGKGVIQTFEERVQESAFPLATVREQLALSGFRILQSFDSLNATPTDSSDRIYFVCRRETQEMVLSAS